MSKKVVLIFEDKGSISYNIKDYIEELGKGFEVYIAFTVNDATSYFEEFIENKNDICGIVIDLNINPFGFTEEQLLSSKNGAITGWIWLKDIVLSQNQDLRKKTIIYSDYLNILSEYVNSEEIKDIEKVSKRNLDGSVQQLINKISNKFK